MFWVDMVQFRLLGRIGRVKTTKKRRERKRSPVVLMVVEGRNKTETLYFENFSCKDIVIKCKSNGETDIENMAIYADKVSKEHEIGDIEGDKIYCVFDLDLDDKKYHKYLNAVEKWPKISFIPSNPCFEVWLMYYFVKNPKALSTSKRVKNELKKLIPNYNEGLNVSKDFLYEHHKTAIERSKNKNKLYDAKPEIIDRNPYTEVGDIVEYILNFCK